MSDNVSEAPGWDAIDQALQAIYPTQPPLHFGNVVSHRLGGPNPLSGISAYKRLEPVPHWHCVTYGFSDLHEKSGDDPEFSGYGFELSFRLKTGADATELPGWVLNFLNNLARYVFETGRIFQDGQYMTANGPIALAQDTRICAMLFAFDPELPAIDTPNGKVEFLQVVGITDDEELALKQWSAKGILSVFGPQLPLLVTDLARPSLLAQPLVAEQVRAGMARDGSNTGLLFVEGLSWQQPDTGPKVLITLGADLVAPLCAVLPQRLRFGRAFELVGVPQVLRFQAAASAAASGMTFTPGDETLTLHLSELNLSELLQALQPKAGDYTLASWPGVLWRVTPTTIRDQHGHVVEVVG